MSLEQRDLVILATGGSEKALSYILRALGVTEGAEIPPETHQAFITTMVYLVAHLEANLSLNLNNPEAFCLALDTIDDLVREIVKKTLDNRPKGGIIQAE